MVDHSIKGKTVLIAGGGKNLGALVARDLAEQGAKAIAVHYNSAVRRPKPRRRSRRSAPPVRKRWPFRPT